MPETPQKPDQKPPQGPFRSTPGQGPAEAPCFDTDLHIGDKPGTEFAGLRTARLVAPRLAGQTVMGALGLAGILYVVLRYSIGLSLFHTLLIALPVGAGAVVYSIGLTFRVSGGGRKNDMSCALFARPTTDTRHRLRAVIPAKRRSGALERWALLASGFPIDERTGPPQADADRADDDHPFDDRELEAVRGGFEPLILRPWMGVVRDRSYRLVMLGSMLAITAFILVVGGSTMGRALFSNTFAIWGVIAIVLGASWFISENAFPVYLRLAPGRLDIFRYRFLGRGKPAVTTYDLRTIPLCVDFGSATIALEPPREPGTRVPDLVLSKKWPYFQEHASGSAPEYISVALNRQRDTFCRRVIQAARTTEPTPPLPDDRLLG